MLVIDGPDIAVEDDALAPGKRHGDHKEKFALCSVSFSYLAAANNAKQAQPISSATPPIGVMAPSAPLPVNASA